MATVVYGQEDEPRPEFPGGMYDKPYLITGCFCVGFCNGDCVVRWNRG